MKKIILYATVFFLFSFISRGFEEINKNSFKTVKIGDQEWMAENLNVSVFRNGDPIPEARTDNEWVQAGKEGKPAWCYYDNKNENGTKYGKLYNWYAVNDPRGLAPEGWHISSDKEWVNMTNFLGGDDYCGILLKSTSGWLDRGNGTNQTGFGALPAGSRDLFGVFKYIGELGYWWTGIQRDNELAWYRAIDKNPYYVYRTNYTKMNGLSVRCIKN